MSPPPAAVSSPPVVHPVSTSAALTARAPAALSRFVASFMGFPFGY
ncbi:hypothetical protein ACFPRL_19205 [Pseudoclavibacter helvolus]